MLRSRWYSRCWVWDANVREHGSAVFTLGKMLSKRVSRISRLSRIRHSVLSKWTDTASNAGRQQHALPGRCDMRTVKRQQGVAWAAQDGLGTPALPPQMPQQLPWHAQHAQPCHTSSWWPMTSSTVSCRRKGGTPHWMCHFRHCRDLWQSCGGRDIARASLPCPGSSRRDWKHD